MSEIEFTEKEKIKLKEIASLLDQEKIENLYPKVLVKGGLLDWCIRVCKYHGISVDDFKSPKRNSHLFRARIDFTHIILKYKRILFLNKQMVGVDQRKEVVLSPTILCKHGHIPF